MQTDGAESKTWQKTNVESMYLHKSGIYYYRTKVNGRQIWESLKTKSKSIAIERISDKLKATRTHRKVTRGAITGKLTVGQAIDGSLREVNSNPDITNTTKRHRHYGAQALLKTWPELERMDPRKLTARDVIEWSNRIRTTAPRHIPHNARTAIRNGKTAGVSVSHHNRLLDALRIALDFAVESGAAVQNVARAHKVKRPAQAVKKLKLPDKEEFHRLIAAMREIGGRAIHSADFCELLAFTGARRNEAQHLLWSDVDFERNRVCLRVTKNGDARYVPLTAECRELLERMRENQPFASHESPVAQVFEAQKSIDHAAEKANVSRITHHDLRHLFATTCIEAGIDIPTVARFLGHKDGGALAMKTYGHLRDDHAQAMMARVSYRNVSPEPGKVVPMQKGAA